MHAGMQIELFCERRYRGEAEIWDKASKVAAWHACMAKQKFCEQTHRGEAEVGRAKQKFCERLLFNDNRRDGVCQRIRILIEYV